MFISESADINLDDFTWLVFKRRTSFKSQPKQYNQRHTLVLEYGDVFGVNKTRKNVYQLVKLDATHVLYRNISPRAYENIAQNTIAYTERVKPEPEGTIKPIKRVYMKENAPKQMKRTDPFFKPLTTPKGEEFELDYSNYQWRKVLIDGLKVVTRKQGKTRTVLQRNELIGLRYVSQSKGAFLIHDDNQRINITHSLYVDLVESSKNLPLGQQRTGTAVVEEPAVQLENAKKGRTKLRQSDMVELERPEPEHDPVVPKYDLSATPDLDIKEVIKKNNQNKKRTALTIEQLMQQGDEELDEEVQSLPDLPDWEEGDMDELFEDADSFEYETEDVAPEPRTDLDSEPSPESAPTPDTDEDDDGADVDGDEDDDGDEDEYDYDLDDADVTDAVDLESEIADILVPQTVFLANSKRYVVISADIMERNDSLMEYIVFDLDQDDEEAFYKFRLPVDYTITKTDGRIAVQEKQLPNKEFKPIVSMLEYAKPKPIAFTK